DRPAAFTRLSQPIDTAVGPDGVVHILEQNGRTLRRVTGSSAEVEADGLSSASAIAVDNSGRVYISSGNTIQRLEADGRLLTIAGAGAAPGFSGDDGPALQARLAFPRGMAFDSAGSLYF